MEALYKEEPPPRQSDPKWTTVAGKDVKASVEPADVCVLEAAGLVKHHQGDKQGRWMDERMDDGLMNRWMMMDGCVNGQMVEWVDG